MIHLEEHLRKWALFYKFTFFIFVQGSDGSTGDKWFLLKGEIRSSLILAFNCLKLFHLCELISYFKLLKED